MFKDLKSPGLLREINPEKGTVTSVIATDQVARDGAIIEPKGWDFSNYRLNPVILWQHDDTAMPFARTAEGPFVSDKELVAKAQFDMDDPRAVEAVRKIAGGFINATSVRWLPKKTEVREMGEGEDKREVLVFLEQELLEWSFVGIPADPGAQILRADGEAFNVDDYRTGTDGTDYGTGTAIDYGSTTITYPGSCAHGSITEDLERLIDEDREHIVRLEARLQASTTKAEEDKVAELVALYVARERPSITDSIIASIARITGQTPERIRLRLAEGGTA